MATASTITAVTTEAKSGGTMNRAAELGPQKFPWWPDWRGECVAIVGSGPSVKNLDLKILQDRIHVIAIKVAVDLCPFAEIVYGCDAPWWVSRNGLPKFKGLKIFHGAPAAQFKELHRCEIDISKDQILTAEPMKIGNGGNSGFQALNLAAQFGATNILLVGLDCHDRGGVHWYGRNTWLNANNPMQTNFNRWMKGFDAAKKDLKNLGISVVNTSMESEIKSFPKQQLPEVMENWGL
jgi:hypothetical protein